MDCIPGTVSQNKSLFPLKQARPLEKGGYMQAWGCSHLGRSEDVLKGGIALPGPLDNGPHGIEISPGGSHWERKRLELWYQPEEELVFIFPPVLTI